MSKINSITLLTNRKNTDTPIIFFVLVLTRSLSLAVEHETIRVSSMRNRTLVTLQDELLD